MKLYRQLGLMCLLTFVFSGCAVQKNLMPTGGSRADGTIRLSYDKGIFETVEVNTRQGDLAAKQRCMAWGYTAAAPFGGATESCVQYGRSGCIRTRVTVMYQCMGGAASNAR